MKSKLKGDGSKKKKIKLENLSTQVNLKFIFAYTTQKISTRDSQTAFELSIRVNSESFKEFFCATFGDEFEKGWGKKLSVGFSGETEEKQSSR